MWIVCEEGSTAFAQLGAPAQALQRVDRQRLALLGEGSVRIETRLLAQPCERGRRIGTVWTEVITNKSNGKSVNFMRDLKGQKEQWLINSIEIKDSTNPVDDVIFTSMVIKLSDSQPKACVPNVQGTNDYFAPPRASADGKTCCISKLILRASGIMASSPNTP